MTTTGTARVDGLRSRTITWSDPARVRRALRGLDELERGRTVSTTLPAVAGFTTLELSTNVVRPITQATGRVHAEGRVVHRGDRVATTEARVYDNARTRYAHAKSTCLVQRGARQ